MFMPQAFVKEGVPFIYVDDVKGSGDYLNCFSARSTPVVVLCQDTYRHNVLPSKNPAVNSKEQIPKVVSSSCGQNSGAFCSPAGQYHPS